MPPKYPNQQLRAVALETFFPGSFVALGQLAAVQRELDGAFPDLYVPNVELGKPLALSPYVFRDEPDTRFVGVGLNQLSFGVKRYPGFEEFSQEALDLLHRLSSILGITRFSRVQFRYENELGLGLNPDGTVPADQVLHHDLSVFGLRGLGLLNMDIKQRRSGGLSRVVTLRVGEGRPISKVTISIVAALEPGGSVEQLRESTDRVHDEAVATFEAMISDDYRAFLRGAGETGEEE